MINFSWCSEKSLKKPSYLIAHTKTSITNKERNEKSKKKPTEDFHEGDLIR